MNSKVIIIGVIAVIVLGAGIIALTRGQKDETVEVTASPSAAPITESNNQLTSPAIESSTSESTTGTVKEFTVTGTNYSFTPKTMSVNVGDTVKITFKSSGGTHDLVLDDFNVATKELNNGQQETIEFVANKAGSFEYYCSISNHRQMGMTGMLTVQ